MRHSRWLCGFLAVAALLLCGGCATTDYVTGAETYNFYTLKDDVRIGQEVYTQTIEQMREQGVAVNEDRERVHELQTMVDRIVAVSDIPQFPYEVALIHTNVANAMAAPGGKIMVFEGLWDREKGLVRDRDELAAVLAHEIAHVNARHSTEAMTRDMGPSILFAIGAAYAQSQEKEEFARILAATSMVYQAVVVTHYSRRTEYEADRVGMMYMARAGYNPEAAVRIWRRVVEEQGRGHSPLSFISTHPSAPQRVQQLEAMLPRAMEVYRETGGF